MIRSVAKARITLSALLSTVPELTNLVITNSNWDQALRIREFLETAAHVTQNQPVVHLYHNFLVFAALERTYRNAISKKL